MKNRIPQNFIQEVLARNDIVEIIRSRVQLTQRGDKHIARCPFHEEKTPSFNVSHSKQFYYCFGCSAGGNAIGFLIAFDRMTFREAVAYLASRAGLELPADTNADNTQHYPILYQILDSAMQYYCLNLRQNPNAVHYLQSRGVSGATAKKFALGYASANRYSLSEKLNDDQEKNQALIESGMVIRTDSERPYDRFRERIMFPIRNSQGKIIAFGGRTITQIQPKYLNSPETPIFHKGHELYGLYEARQAGPLSQLLIVEGYMDVLALHQHGITQAVATLGTAITSMQIQKCLRYVNHLIFCFDGDGAGRKAAWKALTLTLPLLREGIHIRFLFLPEKEDPDSLIKKIGAKNFLTLLEQSQPLSQVFFNELKSQNPLTTPADKAQLGQQAMNYLNTMPHGLFRQLMYEQLAKELDLSTEKLHELMPSPSATTTEHIDGYEKKLPVSSLSKKRKKVAVMSPPLRVIRALLQNHGHNFSDSIWQCIMEWPEETAADLLLKQIGHILKDYPTINLGLLLSHIEDEKHHQLLTDLASQSLPISAEEAYAEIKGALYVLKKQKVEEEVQNMVDKAKKSQLNLEEKRKLQLLLSKLKKDACER